MEDPQTSATHGPDARLIEGFRNVALGEAIFICTTNDVQEIELLQRREIVDMHSLLDQRLNSRLERPIQHYVQGLCLTTRMDWKAVGDQVTLVEDFQRTDGNVAPVPILGKQDLTPSLHLWLDVFDEPFRPLGEVLTVDRSIVGPDRKERPFRQTVMHILELPAVVHVDKAIGDALSTNDKERVKVRTIRADACHDSDTVSVAEMGLANL